MAGYTFYQIIASQVIARALRLVEPSVKRINGKDVELITLSATNLRLMLEDAAKEGYIEAGNNIKNYR